MDETAGGAGLMPEEVALEGRPVQGDDPESGEEELEGVRLSADTQLKDLKELCKKLGLPTSGGKAKILKRLRSHYEVLEKQMSTEVARKMYAEAEREPGTLKTPVLPSSRQQELHNITHHPFQPWCEACVLGRSRQNPHKSRPAEHEGDEVPDSVPDKPVVQIDYCYTFTKHRWQGQGEQAAQGDDQGQPEAEQQQQPQEEDAAAEEIDYRDQFGLCLVAVESTTGWMQAIPILEKGATSLKRVAEQLVRLTLQASPGSAVVVQSDTEPSAKQVLNAVEACRAKLGLVTEKRWVPKASHASNGRVEKAIDTVRRNALTLKAFLESRVGGVIEGHRHIYSWLFRHAAFLYNRFHVSVRGGTPHEILQGRRYRGALVPFGEVVIFYKGSRLVGREFRTMSAYTQELFAPASTLAATHAFLAVALTRKLEVCTFDFKDAYLQVDQPVPMTIEVAASMFGADRQGTVTLVLDKLLPGQRIGASAWFGFAKDLLAKGGYAGFVKEPTLFKKDAAGSQAGVILHADDGLMASTAAEREELKKVLREKVQVEFSDPMVGPGDEIQFLKRKYVMGENGIFVYSNGRYLEALVKALGDSLKVRDAPADNSFLEADGSKELGAKEAKEYREATGRLLYLSHTRPDIPVCILSSKMSCPTVNAQKWLKRTVGYLASVPEIGFEIRPIRNGATFDFGGGGIGDEGGKVVVEAITDADWAGCRRTRRSRTSVQLYAGGSYVCSFVRSQKSIALSSGESEFVALVSGAAEAIYLSDCVSFLVEPQMVVETKCRTDSAACKGIANRLGCGRVRHLACGLLWVQQCVKEGRILTGSIPGVFNPADLGTKPLSGGRVRELLFTMGAVEPDGQPYGRADKEAADHKRMVSQALKECRESSGSVSAVQVNRWLPVLLLMAQAGQGQGLSLAAPIAALAEPEFAYSLVAAAGIGLVTMVVFLGIPFTVLKLLKWSCSKWVFRAKTRDATTQTDTPKPKVEPKVKRESDAFAQEYVDRCTDLQALLSERCRQNREMERALYEVRTQNRALTARVEHLSARRSPQEICVTMSRGERYHLPGCHNIRNRSNVMSFSPCQACLGG